MEGEKKKILIVDDDAFLLDMYAFKFSQNEFEVYTASGGVQTIAKLKEGLKPDIILMDINLGDDTMDGVSLMKKIKKNKKHATIKIFAVTAYSEDTEAFMNDGFDGVYVKPVIKEEIFDFINKNISNIYITK